MCKQSRATNRLFKVANELITTPTNQITYVYKVVDKHEHTNNIF